MKKGIIVLGFLGWPILFASVGYSLELNNGNFEQKDADRNRPASWHHNARNATDLVEMVWDGEVVHSGDYAVSIRIKQNYPEEKAQVSWMWVTTAYGLAAGDTYRLRAWIKTENLGFTPTILIQFKDANDRFLSRAATHSNSPIVGSTDWTEVSVVFLVPERTSHVKIRATLKATQNFGGQVWFDDVTLTKVEN